jgi:hypothetical protein
MSHNKLILMLYLISGVASAANCPPAELIKSAIFTSAAMYDESLNDWELTSAPFSYEGASWQVSYGLTLTTVTNAQEALVRGQLQFQQADIVHPYPPADPIPGYLFCDYTHSAMAYWIQATSPG